MNVVLTKGLAATAVLSTSSMQYALHADLYLNVTLVIIVITGIICTVGIFTLQRRKKMLYALLVVLARVIYRLGKGVFRENYFK